MCIRDRAYIRVGADVISRTSDVPAEIVSIIQALIIMLVGAQMFLSGLRHKQIVKASSRQLAKEGKMCIRDRNRTEN